MINIQKIISQLVQVRSTLSHFSVKACGLVVHPWKSWCAFPGVSRILSWFGSNRMHHKSKSWSKPRKHLNILATFYLVGLHCAMVWFCRFGEQKCYHWISGPWSTRAIEGEDQNTSLLVCQLWHIGLYVTFPIGIMSVSYLWSYANTKCHSHDLFCICKILY